LTLDRAAKQALIELSLRYDLPIIEDDVYGFLQYDGDPEPPLRAWSGENLFYVGSFSKILAPALRIGWIVAPPGCMTALSFLKEGSDINTGTFAQRVACRYLNSHSLPEHIEFLRTEYRIRRDAMHNALLEHFTSDVHWKRPSAGFFFWVESQLFGNTEELLQEALDNGVAFVPGNAFAADPSRPYSSAMRLNFSHNRPQIIREAVRRIAAVVQERSTRTAAVAI
jgi:2-aminoadipate transaminase